MLTSLTDFVRESPLTLYDNLEFLIRIVLSGILGVIIGLERTRRQKEAGTRTHCIIACTAAAFMILSKYAFADMANSGDPARLAAQVVGGISFIGAGVIFKDDTGIKGLTTAAGMWATAAVGLAIGAGLYWVGLIETGMLVFIQVVLHRFPVGNDATLLQDITVCMADTPMLHDAVQALIDRHDGRIESSNITCEDGAVTIAMIVRLEEPITTEEALTLLRDCPGIRRIAV
ncbi:MAG: MgtC/SapB family protein [Clostridiales bacterium]|nr:MgtC/SapB family protein [Candidatus Cacconaster stercorequi]